jgi:glyoxylase-like metal-dependent hydrolase (beta-lactamase superfamily II)
MANKKVRIIPLEVGTMECDLSFQTLRRGMGKKVTGSLIACYIEGLDKKVLVDTGPPCQERAQRFHNSFKPRVDLEQETPKRLLQIGIKPQDIEIIVLTHLHWDHVGQVDKFPNARIFVSREEFLYSMCPLPPHRLGYEALQLGIEPVFLRSIPQFEYLDLSEKEIIPGLKVFPTPGHTPGSISVEVMTDQGPYIIAGDAISVYDNLKGDPENNLLFLMPGIYMDYIATWQSMERIYRKAHFEIERVIPGHDPAVFKRKSFP